MPSQPVILNFCPADVNECLTPGVCAHGKCINLEGSFRCSCEQGYELTSDGKGCQGIRMPTQPTGPSSRHTPQPAPSIPGLVFPVTLTQTLPLLRPHPSLHPCMFLGFWLSWHICLHGLFQMWMNVPTEPHAPWVSASIPRALSPARPVRVGSG